MSLAKFIDGLKAIFSAQYYSSEKIQLDDLVLMVHNKEIAALLQAKYTPESFKHLFDFCLDKGVFKVQIDQTNGLLQTSAGSENANMSERRWVTDTVRCGEIEKFVDQNAWIRALNTLAKFYNQPEELQAIQKSISDPNFYRQGQLTDGVAHIFMPNTLKRDSSWFNNKRLESHALALQAFCNFFIEQASEKTDAVIHIDSDQLNTFADAITNLATYVKSINTNPATGVYDFAAPSAGPWEEIPFPEGLTWDTEATRAAYASLYNLLFAEQFAENLKPIREQIYNSVNSNWLKDSNTLKELIRSAQQKIEHRLLGSAEPIESPYRPIDISTAFISTSSIKLADNPMIDVANHFKILEFLQTHLVRENGAIRYAPFDLQKADGNVEKVFDAYLADNYWLFPALRKLLTKQKTNKKCLAGEKDYGSTDCSSEEDYIARVGLARPNTEAEWCWLSVMAEAYAKQTQKILSIAKTDKRVLTNDEKKLVEHGIKKATEFINRSYARITPAKKDMKFCYKANGKDCPEFAVPEAYEYVSPLVDSKAKKLTALPGVNTPLAWGIASLFVASQDFCQCLEDMAEIDRVGRIQEMRPTLSSTPV